MSFPPLEGSKLPTPKHTKYHRLHPAKLRTRSEHYHLETHTQQQQFSNYFADGLPIFKAVHTLPNAPRTFIIKRQGKRRHLLPNIIAPN